MENLCLCKKGNLLMSKKTLMTLVASLGFLALTVLSVFGFAATHQAAHAAAGSKTVHLAFTGLISAGQGKGTPLTGGLTEVVQNGGAFAGALTLPGGAKIPTTGQITGAKISITFAVSATVSITGTGKFEKTGDYIGRFQVFAGKNKTADGIWSALPVVNNPSVIALAFVGVDDKGPDTGAIYTGAIVLNSRTLVGTFSLPTGAVIPVTAKIGADGQIRVDFHLSATTHIIGEGQPVKTTAGVLSGFAGGFKGPQVGDMGKWVSAVFTF